MLKKTVQYEDFNGDKQTEVLYFNLNKSELLELEMSMAGGLEQFMNSIMETNDMSEMFRQFKRIVLAAYGVRSDDGKRFMKSPELLEEFTQTAAYDAFFMELVQDENVAADFIKGVIPKDLKLQMEQLQDQDKPKSFPTPPSPPTPPSQ